jgi:hypothetical protein
LELTKGKDELAHTLHQLFLAGDLIITYPGDETASSLIPSLHLITTTLQRSVDGRQGLSYGLTAQAGARWESVSHRQ